MISVAGGSGRTAERHPAPRDRPSEAALQMAVYQRVRTLTLRGSSGLEFLDLDDPGCGVFQGAFNHRSQLVFGDGFQDVA